MLFISNRKRGLSVNTVSSWSPIEADFPQGSKLGPLLFLVYINVAVNDIRSNIRQFADDTTLFIIVDNPVLFIVI